MFGFPKFRLHGADRLAHSISFASQSFALILRPMGVARHDGPAKITGSPNECAAFEQITRYHTNRTIAVAATCPANAPGAVLLYKHNALRVM